MEKNQQIPSLKILDVRVDRLDLPTVVQLVGEFIATKKQAYAVTVNPEFILTAKEDPVFKAILQAANLALADGVGLIFASRFNQLVGKSKLALIGTVPGIDCLQELVKVAAEENLPVFFLGGYEGVARKTALYFQKLYPQLPIAGYFEGDGNITGDEDAREAVRKASHKIGQPVALLFVAFGHPKQEKWIARNLSHVPVKFAMGVGGAFDVISVKKKKAPLFFSKLGLDWLWRVMIEPSRLPRIIRAVVVFPCRVIIG